MAETVTCPECSHPRKGAIGGTTVKCVNCGHEFAIPATDRVCSWCGTMLAPDESVCPKCGTGTDDEPPHSPASSAEQTPKHVEIESRDFDKVLAISMNRHKDGAVSVTTEGGSAAWSPHGSGELGGFHLVSTWYQKPPPPPVVSGVAIVVGFFIGLYFIYQGFQGAGLGGRFIGTAQGLIVMAAPWLIAPLMDKMRSPPTMTLELVGDLPVHPGILLFRARGGNHHSDLIKLRKQMSEFTGCKVKQKTVDRNYRKSDTTTN